MWSGFRRRTIPPHPTEGERYRGAVKHIVARCVAWVDLVSVSSTASMPPFGPAPSEREPYSPRSTELDEPCLQQLLRVSEIPGPDRGVDHDGLGEGSKR